MHLVRPATIALATTLACVACDSSSSTGESTDGTDTSSTSEGATETAGTPGTTTTTPPDPPGTTTVTGPGETSGSSSSSTSTGGESTDTGSGGSTDTEGETGEPENLLPNPGFEMGDTWTVSPNHEIVASDALSGTMALRVTSTGESMSSSTWSDRISADVGEEFVLHSWVQAQGLNAGPNGNGDTPLTVIRFRDDDGFVLNGHGRRTEGYRWAPYINDGDYPYVDDNMLIHFQMTQTGDGFEVGFRTWENNTSGDTFYDDVSIFRRTFPDRGALDSTLQAEDADVITQAFVGTEEIEFTGTGYVDVTDDPGELTWNSVPLTGDYILSVRYSREGFDRPMTIFVDDVEVESLDAAPTGRRGMYATADFNVTFGAGSHTVRLVVNKGGGPLGQPLIDKIDVYELSR